MGGEERTDGGLGRPPSTTPPASVRAAILARVVRQTVGGPEAPLLDGRYRLLREIGRGGAGTVWEAELLPLGRLVAVKLLRPGVAANEHAVARLMREAMSASKLGHDHIVRVNDVGTDEHGSPYVAMELLQGESLAQIVRRCGPLPWPEVAEIALQLCDALSAAHAVGIVHRDLKPANVIATRQTDGHWRCKLLDFGLCTAGTETPMITAAGVLLGTPGYAAPEQIRGESVDGRADLYGLACVMVELLTGRPAFRGASRQEVVANQLVGRRCDVLDGLPGGVVALLDRCLCVSVDRRYDGPEALAAAIRSVGESATLDVVATPWTWRAGIVVAMALGAAALAVTAAQWPSEERVVLSASLPPLPTVFARPPEPPVAPAPPEVVAHVEETPAPPAKPPSPPERKTRKRGARPSPRTEPEPAEPPKRRTYPDGIRDPFAVR